MPDIRVDPDVLAEIAARLDAIRHALADAPGLLADAGALGSPRLAAALDHFVADWSHGRHEIITAIGALTADLHSVAASYRGTDAAVAKGFR